MKTIVPYKTVSGQQLKRDISFFMVTTNTNEEIIDIVKEEARFSRKDSPIIYSG